MMTSEKLAEHSSSSQKSLSLIGLLGLGCIIKTRYCRSIRVKLRQSFQADASNFSCPLRLCAARVFQIFCKSASNASSLERKLIVHHQRHSCSCFEPTKGSRAVVDMPCRDDAHGARRGMLCDQRFACQRRGVSYLSRVIYILFALVASFSFLYNFKFH